MEIKISRAAILAASREPLVVDDVTLPDALDFGQVLVKVHYTSICGAQINEIDAVKGPDRFLPHLLGHEASATVIETGPGVTSTAVGDPVVLHWRPGEGIQSAVPRYGWRGRDLNAGWVTTFNEYAIVSENRLTVVPKKLDRRAAPLLGCAVTTAMGVVNNDAKVAIGESVVVFGAGGVGLNVIQFAAMVAANPIVAVDLVEAKLELARQHGATHALNGADKDLAHALRRIVGPAGADKVIETSGVPRVIEQAYELAHPDGVCVLVGVPSEKVTINTLSLHFNKVLTGSHGGDCQPHRDIPRIVGLMQAGKVSFDKLITHEFALDEINEAVALMRTGNAGRIVLRVGGG